VGQPLPEDDFDRRAPRHADRAPQPDVERPEWLTGSGDASHELGPLDPGDRPAPDSGRPHPLGSSRSHPPGTGPPSPVRPPAAAARRPEATSPSPGGLPRLETDSTLSGYAPPRGSATRGDPDSWEGAVEKVSEGDDFPGDEPQKWSFRSATQPTHPPRERGLQSVLGGLSRFRPMLVVVVVVAIAAVAALMLRPREEQTTSISAIRRHPERFDGQPVKVKGRVGEVFAVGGGYAFHLHQGRENLVVFTRSRVPVRREDVTITGSISNGILDGKPRQALFEAAR